MSSQPPSAAGSTYFVNAWVDWALIGGFSLAAFALFAGPLASLRPRQELGIVLLFLFNWPHFAATNLRLYGSAHTRRQFPITAWVSIVFCALAAAASVASPLLFAPLFLKAFLLWSPFHYSGQTLGLSLVYARRTGFSVGRLLRFALAGFIYLSFMSQSAGAEVLPTGPSHYGVRIPAFNLPGWVPMTLRASMWLCAGVCVLLVMAESARTKKRPPLIFLLPAVAQYVWFVPGADIVGFRELVPIFHSVQYLVVAWAVHLQEGSVGSDRSPRAAWWASTKWGAACLLLGATLLWALPRGAVLLGTNPAITIAVISSAVQIHHFFVDGVIWKIRNRSVTSPLLSNVSTAWRATAAPLQTARAA